MLDAPLQDELNRMKCEGVNEAVLTLRPQLPQSRCQYKVNIQAKTMWRMWRGEQGKAWCLDEVRMLHLAPMGFGAEDVPRREGKAWLLQEEVNRKYPGYELHCQFESAWGWKNFAPVPNADILAALSQRTLTGAPHVTEVTHVWNKDHPVRYTVDFESMTQVFKQCKELGKADLRLVAFPAPLMTPPPTVATRQDMSLVRPPWRHLWAPSV